MDRTPPTIFDRRRLAAKWRRATARQSRKDAASYLPDSMAEDIADRLSFMQRDTSDALVVGGPEGWMEDAQHAALELFDDETPHSGGYDLFVHLLGLGMVNDLPGALIHARNALTQDGLFIAAFPGTGSLPVMRQLTLVADGDRPAARMHPQVDIRAGTALLERAGFRKQVVDSYPLKVRYSALDRLIADLRDQGMTSSLASPAPPITRAGWERAQHAFDSLRDEDGKVTETFEILVLTGWR